MDSLKSLDFSSFIIFSDDHWSLLVRFRQLFKLPLVVQCCDVICEWPLKTLCWTCVQTQWVHQSVKFSTDRLPILLGLTMGFLRILCNNVFHRCHYCLAGGGGGNPWHWLAWSPQSREAANFAAAHSGGDHRTTGPQVGDPDTATHDTLTVVSTQTVNTNKDLILPI